METNACTKLVTFRESYSGESYVAFAENKTESYIFEKFLVWISYYSSTFGQQFSVNRDTINQLKNDFEKYFRANTDSKFVEYDLTNNNCKLSVHFHREDKDFLPTDLHRGHRSYSTAVEIEVDIPSLHDDNILHEDLATRRYFMIITNLEDVRYLEDY